MRSLLIALTLVIGVLWVYAPVRRHDFVSYDDPAYLTENPHVARGLDPAEIRWVFRHELEANYHPLTWVSHMLDVELFGLQPGPHHVVSVALHALNALLVFWLARSLLGSDWGAALAAGLFALHPLRVESVAWASERKDVLCASFFLAASLLYLRYGRAPSWPRYLPVVLACALALLAKPMAVTFPFVALVLDAWPLRRFSGPSGKPSSSSASRAASLPLPSRYGPFLEKLPLLALAALGAWSTVWAQGRGGSTSSLSALALDLRLLNALSSIGTYLAQFVWPRALSVFYPHAAIVSAEPPGELWIPGAFGACSLAAGSLLAWRLRRSVPAVAFGWVFFLVTLAPVIGLVQVGTQAHADRYTYLPALGLSLALAGAAVRGAARARPVWVAAGCLALLALAVTARRQVRFWKDTRALFEHALELDGRNYVALARLGELERAAGDGPAGGALLRRALAIHPSYPEALNNLALCHLDQGELEAARALLERVLQLAPDDYDAWLNLGVVELEAGQLAEARRRLESCLERAPGDARVPFNLGKLATREGQPAVAEQHFLAALELAPEFVDCWSALGQSLLVQGRPREAVEAFARAVALVPGDPGAHFDLGVALQRAGDRERARAELQRAHDLEPDSGLVREALERLEEER